MSAGEHWIVCRHPDPELPAHQWATITGRPGDWSIPTTYSTKAIMVRAAITSFIAAGCSFDLTVTDAPAVEAMADPDAVGSDDFCTVLCPQAADGRLRWVSLNLDKGGLFSVGQIVSGGDVGRWLERITEHYGRERFYREVLQVRPGWVMADLIPEPQRAPTRGAR